MSILITSFAYELLDSNIIEFIAVKSVCDCFPNNLIVSRVQPLNLLSPGFPLEYCDNLNCSTQISLENPLTITNDVECLQIQFNSFRTEIDMDLLHLLQIPSGDEKRELISFGGEAKGIKSFTFDSANFVLNFTTDATELDSGFNLTIGYIKRNKECLCHGTDSNLKVLNGKKNLMKNNFDSKKCLFMDCFWKIEPLKESSEFNHRLLVKLNLSLSDSTEFVEVCADNFLIRNPQCHRLPYLDKIGPVYIWYHREFSPLSSEEVINNPNIPRQINFNYEWRGECKCGEVHLKADKNNWNVLYSPDHPENYCPSMNCSWLLEAPEGYYIVVNISEFYTEADHDFLALFDGNDTNQKHMEMLSGMISFKNTIHSTKNIMAILFNSDISIQMGGFAVWYRAVKNDELLQNQQSSTELSSDNSSSPHRLFLFMFFTLFAVIGILFIVARSNPTNNRFTTIENIFRRIFPTAWTRMFNENEEEEEGGGEGRNQLLGSNTSVHFASNNRSKHQRTIDNNKCISFSTNNPSYNE
uniref:CUB domain-containing protein n=1 Tax=Meloidogyne enterolobii TaxID=390850 RepID=A0A6V7VXY4_MELEN|nr:unnamed protein product [Meloidogyne enterolobii]